MKKLGIFIKNHSPLIFRGQAGHLKYIPGGCLRGAVTSQLFQGRYFCEQLICDTHRWGMEIVFPNCYPNLNAYTFPMFLPATAKSCRRQPGFVHEDDAYRHGVFDTLLNQIIFQQILASSLNRGQQSLIQTGYHDLIEQGNLYCHICHEKAATYQVAYVKPHGNFMEVPTYRQMQDFSRGGHEFISERTWFFGSSFLPDDPNLLKVYKDSLEDIMYLGENQGMGEVEVRVQEIDDHDLSLRQRVLQFNRKYKQKQKEYSLPSSDELITVNLQSETLLRDRQGGLTTRLSASFLEDEIRRIYRRQWGEDDLPRIKCREVVSFARPVYVNKWGWKFSPEAIPAIARGSVFVFSFPQISPRLLSALEQIERSGLGENRGEGYGQIMICDPFHLEAR